MAYGTLTTPTRGDIAVPSTEISRYILRPSRMVDESGVLVPSSTKARPSVVKAVEA